jgi:outer membrane protein assembly factor BamB
MAGSWSPPAFTVDATGRQLVIFGSSSPDNAAYALDATTGERVWRFSPGATYRDADVGAGPTISPPGVNGFADGVAYIIGKNRVVHARNLRTGAAIWQTAIDPIAPRAGGATRSTAALLGNQLVTGYGAGLIALDATTGALIWTTQQGGVTTPEIVSSPAITGPPLDRVVFAQDTGGTLRGFALADGAQRWSAGLGGLGYSSPAVAGDRVFVGAGNGFLYAFGEGTGASARPNTSIASPANGAVVPNPTGDLVISGAATDDTSVHRVLVAVTDTNAGAWWDPATSRWVSVFTQWDATLSHPDTASTGWTARYPVPRSGGRYLAQAEAVDADGQHDPTIPTASYTVTSLGKPPDTAITSPANLQRFPFPRNPDGTVRHQPFKIAIRGSAVDSGGAHPGIQRVLVQVMNREHGEYWCGPGGCPGLPSGTFWRPQPATIVAGLATPGASSTTWTSSFMTYDHPHTYMITAWAVDRDGERDIASATVPMICVREPADRSCHG